jgi:hypothetical protein
MTGAGIGLIVRSAGSGFSPARKARPCATPQPELYMKRMMEVITEAVRDPKHPFRKLDHQPKKPLKNRYERRKVREYLHLGDWQEELA